MAFRGGYKIIDFKNTPITGGKSAVVKGIYSAMENNYFKLLIFHGINLDGAEIADFASYVHSEGGTYTAVTVIGQAGTALKLLEIKIGNDDSVTIETLAIGG